MSAVFHLRLKDLRKGRGYKQREVAERLFLPLRTYQNYERGVNSPDLEMVCSMADFFGVSVDYLVGHTTKEERDSHRDLVLLDEEEHALVDAFRNCNREGRGMLLSLTEVMGQSKRYGS